MYFILFYVDEAIIFSVLYEKPGPHVKNSTNVKNEVSLLSEQNERFFTSRKNEETQI